MKILKRTQAAQSSIAVAVNYGKWVTPEGVITGWTPDRQFAEPVPDDIAEKAIALYQTKPVSGTLEAEDA